MKLVGSVTLILVLTLSGCSTRSISNSGYNSRAYYGGNALYAGELSEFDVLGVRAGDMATDEEISAALANASDRVALAKGDRILLIQSGAPFPDKEMLTGMEDNFSVTVFSGVPEKDKPEADGYANALRLAAAKAGIESIVVYWGVMESGEKNLATKTVSWLPVVGQVLPDESQYMRIRLKIAVVDVASGQWEIMVPESFDDTAISGRINRRASDQSQVALLKETAYARAVEELVLRFVR